MLYVLYTSIQKQSPNVAQKEFLANPDGLVTKIELK